MKTKPSQAKANVRRLRETTNARVWAEEFAKVCPLRGPLGWHARVTAVDGRLVYDGPAPVPSELITITPEMAVRGEVFTFDMTPPVGEADRLEGGMGENGWFAAASVKRSPRKVRRVSLRVVEEKNDRIHALEAIITHKRHRIAELEEIRRFEKGTERGLVKALQDIYAPQVVMVDAPTPGEGFAMALQQVQRIAGDALVEYTRRLGPRPKEDEERVAAVHWDTVGPSNPYEMFKCTGWVDINGKHHKCPTPPSPFHHSHVLA
jgi:hypothetical protein